MLQTAQTNEAARSPVDIKLFEVFANAVPLTGPPEEIHG
jgi:hypothetical protein